MIVTKEHVGKRFWTRGGRRGVVEFVCKPYSTDYPVVVLIEDEETETLRADGCLFGDGRTSLLDIVEWE